MSDREKARSNRRKEKEKKAGELAKKEKLTIAEKLFVAKFGKKKPKTEK